MCKNLVGNGHIYPTEGVQYKTLGIKNRLLSVVALVKKIMYTIALTFVFF